MRKFNNICAQGDVLIRRIESMPESAVEIVSCDRDMDVVIVTHSETGHHHVMDRKSATMFACKDESLLAYLQVHEATTLRHLRPHDTHEEILFEPGVYEVRRQREHTPEGWRAVAD